VRLGVTLPLGPGDVVGAAARIEAAGLDSAWVLDAHNRGFLLQDPIAALAMAAAVTSRIELGSCIIQVPLRHPFELAQRALTVQLASGGRFLFGVGAGSTAADFAAFGLDVADRFRLLDAHLDVMRRLWAGEEVEGARLAPWPAVVGGPPVLVGAFSGRWIERAARELDGWIGSARSTDVATLRAGLARFRAAGGRRAVAANLAASRPDAADVLAELAEAGFDDAVLLLERHDDAELARVRALVAA
jgi:alkanesulfonate monooxygenase SsuD/methylene tetrahydromethanopterin reductase-like flavin-dependent oxidoreductase (luciferase family)